MSLISIHGLSIAYGGPLILDDVSLNIESSQRIAFLGRNGTGKSTLLKILSGETIPDSGKIITSPGVRIAYLPQEVPEGLSGSIYEVVVAGAGPMGVALARLHGLQGHTPEIEKLHNDISSNDGWRIDTVVARLLEQMGLEREAEVSTLSGGMLRRVMLARALVLEPDVLLLDEPTNHLDVASIKWLEEFVLGARLTVLFVTHDRRLLKRLATRIIELDRGRLVDWSCDYETFLVHKQAVLDAEETAWEKFDKKLAQEEVWIRRGIKARRTRNEGRVRALERMREDRRKRRERSGTVSMTISGAGRSGSRVLETEHLSFGFGATAIVRDLTMAIMRGDRIGILGPNGCGKTTLINLLLGKLTPSEGTIKTGANISVSYFDQLRESLDPEKSVWENVAADGRDTVIINGIAKHVVSYLQDFLFTTDRTKSPVKQLSGGERNRLMLARLFTSPANVLVFDEPTNDLDIETLDLLEELLLEYAGTVLIVSHDREFLNNIVTDTLVFEGDGVVKEYVGGYDDWEQQAEAQRAAALAAAPKRTVQATKAQSAGSKKISYKEKLELEALPGRIELLEETLARLNSAMADPAQFAKPGFVAQAKADITRVERELEEAFHRWGALDSRTGS